MTDIHSYAHQAMATEFKLSLQCTEQAAADTAAHAVFERVDVLENILSRFRPDSDISRINRMKAEESLPIEYETWEVLKMAFEIQQLSHGAFDCGVAQYLDVFRKIKEGLLLSSNFDYAIAKVHREKHSSVFFIDPDEALIHCVRPGMYFDLGGIGKGFALDQCRDLLLSMGHDTFELNAGESTRLFHSPLPDTWTYHLEGSTAEKQFALENMSISATGTGFQGQHVFDPRSGSNRIQHYDRTWVATTSAAYSDALSTACFLMKENELQELVKAHPQILWIAYLKDEKLYHIK